MRWIVVIVALAIGLSGCPDGGGGGGGGDDGGGGGGGGPYATETLVEAMDAGAMPPREPPVDAAPPANGAPMPS